MQRIRRHGDGLVVSLTDAEVALLRAIPDDLRRVLESPIDRDDPVSDRLFPRAYLDPTEESAEQEWRDLVHTELVGERVAALQRLTATLDAARSSGGAVEVVLEPVDVQAWLGALNDARLALGTRLRVTEDADWGDLPPDHPDASGFALYDWLTGLQDGLLRGLLGE